MTSQPRIETVAAAIETIANNLPFKKPVSYNDRIKLATRLVKSVFDNNRKITAKSALTRNALLRIASAVVTSTKSGVGLQDLTTGQTRTYPNLPYTEQSKGPINKGQAQDKTYPPSVGLSGDECVASVMQTAPSLTKEQANVICNTAKNGDNMKGGQFDNASCVSYLRSQGINDPEVVCKGLQDSVTKGAVKSASIPAWAIINQDDISIEELEKTFNEKNLKQASAENDDVARTLCALHDIPYHEPTRIKSASAQNAPIDYFVPEGIVNMHNRKRQEREIRAEQQNEESRAIKSAKRKKDGVEIPAWAIIAGYEG